MDFIDEVIEHLKEYAVSINGSDPASLSPETRFEEDLGCKSIQYVQFTSKLEDEYEVEVPFMAFKRCRTFRDAAEYIQKLLYG